MITDLKSMTVEELREMEWRADEHADFSGYKIHAVAEEAFDELARRLEEAQQKIAEAKAEALEELQVLCSKFNIPLPKIVGNQAAGYRAKAGAPENPVPDLRLFLEDRSAYVGERYEDRMLSWTIQGIRLRELVERIRGAAEYRAKAVGKE